MKSKKIHEVASCDLVVVSSLPKCQSNEKEEEIVTKSQFTMQSLDLGTKIGKGPLTPKF